MSSKVPAALKPSGIRFSTQLAQTERRNRVLRLIRAGATTSQVVEIFLKGDPEKGIAPEHITPGQVTSLVKRYLEKLHMEDAATVEELRALENERLDELQQKLWPKVMAGELPAIDRALRLSERRSKLNGLDFATKVQHDLGPELLRELGIDPERLAAGEEAFKSAYADLDIPDVDIIDESSASFDEAIAALPPGPASNDG